MCPSCELSVFGYQITIKGRSQVTRAATPPACVEDILAIWANLKFSHFGNLSPYLNHNFVSLAMTVSECIRAIGPSGTRTPNLGNEPCSVELDRPV